MDRIGQHPQRTVLAAIVAIQLAVGLVAAVVVAPPEASAVSVGPIGRPAPRLEQQAGEPLVPAAPPPVPVPGEVDAADATGATVALFKEPGGDQPFKTLTNPTWEKVPLVLMVLEDRGAWLHVRVNTRPNGSTAWIRRSEVSLRRVANRIVVDLGARRLTVLHGNDVLTEHKVAIGSPSAPTPVGEFYVDTIVVLRSSSGPYGAGQLSVSGFSNVHQTFGGGIGQIAIHGTNNPKSIGGTVSAGCIRMLNDAWMQVAALAPSGTPVSIRA